MYEKKNLHLVFWYHNYFLQSSTALRMFYFVSEILVSTWKWLKNFIGDQSFMNLEE